MAFLKFLLTLVLIYFVAKIVYQLVVPAQVRQMISAIRAAAKQRNNPDFMSEEPKHPEGAVTITQNDPAKGGKNNIKDSAEYVDYEEVD